MSTIYSIEQTNGSRRITETTYTQISPRYNHFVEYTPITRTYAPQYTEIIEETYVRAPRISVTRSKSPRNLTVENVIYKSRSPVRYEEIIYTSQPRVFTFEYPRYTAPLTTYNGTVRSVRTSYRTEKSKNSENLSTIEENCDNLSQKKSENFLEVENLPRSSHKANLDAYGYLQPNLKAPEYESSNKSGEILEGDLNFNEDETCISYELRDSQNYRFSHRVERERCNVQSKLKSNKSLVEDWENKFEKNINNLLRTNTMKDCFGNGRNDVKINWEKREEILKELLKEESSR